MPDVEIRRSVLRAMPVIGCFLSLYISPVWAAPLVLDNNDLQAVTAGSAVTGTSGGVVVGNSSVASIEQQSDISLNGNAQMEARGLNLVNGADSAVANGVNVWDGSGFNSAMEVNQINNIDQEQQRSAAIEGYHRSQADTLVHTENATTEAHDIHSNRYHSAADVFQEERLSNNQSTGNVDTLLKFKAGDQLKLEANIGNGVAVAGQLESHFDGGEAQIALAVGGGISANAGLDIGEIAGIEVGVDADVTFSILADIKLPEMDIKLNGGGCGVILGSCNSSGSTEEQVTTLIDHSTLDTLDEHSTGSMSSAESRTAEYRSAFTLDKARAEYIVLDNSSLEMSDNHSLNVSGEAQSKVRGLNVVNAVGSAVANAVNIARNAQMDNGGRLIMNQINDVYHSR